MFGAYAISFISNIVGDVAGSLLGTKQQAKAATAAAATQAASAEKGIAAVNTAGEQALGYQQPYLDAGSKAIAQQMSLLGLNGTAGQQDAISGLLNSPNFTTQIRQGEEAILQNAAATGGLRGGNVQTSLANFRADQYANAYQQYLGNIGQLTGVGQQAAGTAGQIGVGTGQSIAGLYGVQGQATAGGQIAAGNTMANTINAGAQVANAVAAFLPSKTPTAPVVRAF